MRRAMAVCALILGAAAMWACGAFASGTGGAAGTAGGDPAAAGEGVAGPRIVMRVRLSARPPLRFTLKQDSAAMAVLHEVVAQETTLGRSFTSVLGGLGSDEEAYEVEVARLRRVDEALGLRSALAARLPYSDKVRYLPYIRPDGDEWVLRIGMTGDPDAAYKLRAVLAWVGTERGFVPTPVIVKPQVVEKARLAASGGPYEVRAGDLPGEVVLATPSGEVVSFLGEGVRIVPRDPLDIAFTLGGVSYRGELQITRRDSWDGTVELVATNRVDIERYVEGVLAGEVYPNWEMEALKAQAVAARTYALYRKAGSYGREYDVDDTVAYQRYSGGHSVESFRRAVAETRGEVITYQGRLIKAHYFASGGGTTEGDEEVWLGGGDEPYLEAVADFDQASPHYVWQNPPALWAADFLTRIGLEAVFPAWVEPALVSGDRILSYRFRTPSDSVTLTREEVRRKLGLKSPRFTVRLVDSKETGVLLTGIPGAPRDSDMTGERDVQLAAISAGNAAAEADGAGGTDAAAKPVLPEVGPCVPVREGDVTTGYRVRFDKDVLVTGKAVGAECAGELSPTTLVIIDGVGYGHGVGLSQWGAQGMAVMRDESGGPAYDYVDILKHYYTGVDVVGNYNLPVAAATTRSGVVPAPDIPPGTNGPDQAGKLEPGQRPSSDQPW